MEKTYLERLEKEVNTRKYFFISIFHPIYPTKQPNNLLYLVNCIENIWSLNLMGGSQCDSTLLILYMWGDSNSISDRNSIGIIMQTYQIYLEKFWSWKHYFVNIWKSNLGSKLTKRQAKKKKKKIQQLTTRKAKKARRPFGLNKKKGRCICPLIKIKSYKIIK